MVLCRLAITLLALRWAPALASPTLARVALIKTTAVLRAHSGWPIRTAHGHR